MTANVDPLSIAAPRSVPQLRVTPASYVGYKASRDEGIKMTATCTIAGTGSGQSHPGLRGEPRSLPAGLQAGALQMRERTATQETVLEVRTCHASDAVATALPAYVSGG